MRRYLSGPRRAVWLAIAMAIAAQAAIAQTETTVTNSVSGTQIEEPGVEDLLSGARAALDHYRGDQRDLEKADQFLRAIFSKDRNYPPAYSLAARLVLIRFETNPQTLKRGTHQGYSSLAIFSVCRRSPAERPAVVRFIVN